MGRFGTKHTHTSAAHLNEISILEILAAIANVVVDFASSLASEIHEDQP